MNVDVLIVGRGIAGAVLAEVLRQRGLRVHVFDRKRAGNASMVAAGVVNPLVFRRDVPSWRAAQLLAVADAFYSEWQQRVGVPCWQPLPLVKVFPTPKEVEQWHRAMAQAESALFATQMPEPEVDRAPLHVPHGYGTVHGSGWLDLPALLGAQHAELLAEGALTERDVEGREVVFTNGGVQVGEVHARWLVRCQGPFATQAGLVPVKGETLVVRIPGLVLTRMVHRGVFLLPLGKDLFRVGATYGWDDVFSGPTEAGATWLLEKLSGLVHAPVDVVEHSAGVRPAAKDRRPILGITGPQEAVFNGLGSRGVLLAPWCAQQLADHLFQGVPLDPEVDAARF